MTTRQKIKKEQRRRRLIGNTAAVGLLAFTTWMYTFYMLEMYALGNAAIVGVLASGALLWATKDA